MKKTLLSLTVALAVAAVAPVLRAAPAATQPATAPAAATSDPVLLELAATQAFNGGDYVKALPLFQKLAIHLKDSPERLGSVEEKIRVARRKIAADPQLAAAERPLTPEEAENRKPHARPKEGAFYEVAIKELGNFAYDSNKGGGIPDDIVKLNGTKLRTSGFMVPLDQADNITEFAVVPSLFACCNFGSAPQIQHTIVVRCPKGKAVSYFPDEIVVEGVLKVDEKKDDGYVISLFEMECTSVRPAAK